MRLLVFTMLWPLMALAHQSTLTSGGTKVSWPLLQVPLAINTNTSDLPSDTTRNLILNSINQWNSAASAQVSSNSASGNTISFSEDFSIYGSGVVGVTELSYNTSGTIQRAHIILNDNYQFMDTPGFYTSNQVFLGDVVTHELGHFLGLSHSEVLDSSMFYSSFSGQSTVSYDDRSGIRQKYVGGFGSISGTMKGGNRVGVLGVHVQAISRTTGEAVGAFSDENGRFVISGLDLSDTFYLYTSPLKHAEALPGYFSNTQKDFCPGSYIGSFFSACGKENEGFPQAINLTRSTPDVDVGVVTINCSIKTYEEYNYQKLQTTFSPVTIFDYAREPKYAQAFVGHFLTSFSTSWSAWDHLEVDLRNFSDTGGDPKYLKLSLMGRKLGNQLEYEVRVKHNGSDVPSATRTKTYSGVTQTWETDLEVLLPLGAPDSNIFEVSIRSRKLLTSQIMQTFPAFEQFSTNKPLPYLLISSLFESPSSGIYRPLMDSESVLSDNSSCLDAPFTYQVSKTKSKEQASGSEKAAAAAASCGTIEPPQGGGGSLLLTLCCGFILAALGFQLSKSHKKFLS